MLCADDPASARARIQIPRWRRSHPAARGDTPKQE